MHAAGGIVDASVNSFASRFGHIAYREVHAKGVQWRVEYVARYPDCEFPGCDFAGDYGIYGLVFDHCHDHGWVRGAICVSHNVRIGRIEAVINMPGITVDLGETDYGRYIARCPDCSGADVLPAAGEFRHVYMSAAVSALVESGRIPRPDHNLWLSHRAASQIARNLRAEVLQGAIPIAHPRSARAHLPVTDTATACGRIAEGMAPAPQLPLCQTCDRARAR